MRPYFGPGRSILGSPSGAQNYLPAHGLTGGGCAPTPPFVALRHKSATPHLGPTKEACSASSAGSAPNRRRLWVLRTAPRTCSRRRPKQGSPTATPPYGGPILRMGVSGGAPRRRRTGCRRVGPSDPRTSPAELGMYEYVRTTCTRGSLSRETPSWVLVLAPLSSREVLVLVRVPESEIRVRGRTLRTYRSGAPTLRPLLAWDPKGSHARRGLR